jgi:hypothetical protein
MIEALTDQKKEEILKLLIAGETYNSISSKCNVCLFSVNKIAVKNNIVRSKGVKKGYREETQKQQISSEFIFQHQRQSDRFIENCF